MTGNGLFPMMDQNANCSIIEVTEDEVEVTMTPHEISEMPIVIFKLEDLTDERLRKHVLKVRAKGHEVCSKCRWSSGCLACDGDKAWNWAVSKELGISKEDLV